MDGFLAGSVRLAPLWRTCKVAVAVAAAAAVTATMGGTGVLKKTSSLILVCIPLWL